MKTIRIIVYEKSNVNVHKFYVVLSAGGIPEQLF